MKGFKKKGELTRFQILAEIAKQEPHIRQKDIANRLGITIQAVSENIQNLTDEGLVETSKRPANYMITKRGIEKVKNRALNLRKYADEVLYTMNTYKSIWPAIASEKLKSGDKVWLEMKEGVLYATTHETSANAEVLNDAEEGEDVALIKHTGLIELETGSVLIIRLPHINEGGSRNSDLNKIKDLYNDPNRKFDRVGVIGTVSRVVASKSGINVDFEFATLEATIVAAKKGLNILLFVVGKMTHPITQKLEDEGISYSIENATE